MYSISLLHKISKLDQSSCGENNILKVVV